MERMTLPTKAAAAVRICLALIVALPLLTIPGCGGGEDLPETAEVSGTVSYKGQPVAGAEVNFSPETGNPGFGITEEDGTFELTTYDSGDGAVPGTHTVTVQLFPQESLPGMEAESVGMTAIPGKYASAETTPLKEDVKSGEKNEFTFDLVD